MSPSLPRVLLLTGLLVLSTACKKQDQEAPSQADLPALHSLPHFELTDQTGKSVSPEQLRGTPWLAAFMFTRCPSICPRITERMKEVQSALQAESLTAHLVSITVDPDHDTPEVLQKYGERYQIDTKSWSFWTGPYQTIAQAAEAGFKVGISGQATEGADHLGITHGSHLILVDGEGKIRGYYGSFDEDLLPRLLSDVRKVQPQ